MAAGGKTKFVIPPFRQSQAMDEEYANRTWQTLHSAIHEIHRQNASGLSFEELYRNAYNMVLHKFGDKLYNGLVETITLHLRGVAQEVAVAADGDFLPQLKEKWEKHRLSSIMIRDILMYMDRTYVVAQKKVAVFERGLQIFRDEVCRNDRIKAPCRPPPLRPSFPGLGAGSPRRDPPTAPSARPRRPPRCRPPRRAARHIASATASTRPAPSSRSLADRPPRPSRAGPAARDGARPDPPGAVLRDDRARRHQDSHFHARRARPGRLPARL